MPDESPSHTSHEPHPWAEMTPDQVFDMLVYELYTSVSALGDELDRLSTGAFEADEQSRLLNQMRERVNTLSRLVVTLKLYTAERQDTTPPSEP